MQAIGLIFSLLLHGALIGYAAYEIMGTDKLPEPAAPTIEAEIISISEFTKLKQGDPESKRLEAKATPEEEKQVSKKEAPKSKPEPPKPPQATEPPPPETPPETQVAKLETPEPPQPSKPDDIAEKIDSSTPPIPAPPNPDADAEARKKKAELQRKIREKQKKEEEARRKKEAERKKKLADKKKREAEKKRKAKKKQEDFTKRMAALLDKTPEERGSKRSGTSQETDYTGPTAGEREGQGNELTAREEDLLKGRISSQIRDCWRLPGGGGGIDVAVVTVRWRLKRDGQLDGQPQIIGARSDPVYRIAGEAAVRAVTCAAPFKLPPEMYKNWQEITWEFDPRHML